ncbi:hypothetical protein D3C72_1201640 [compost metagenome]
MRRVFQKAPLAVQRAFDAQQQLIDGSDERTQFAGHSRLRQRGQIERAAPFDGHARAVHLAERPAHHHAGHRGQQQEQDGDNDQPAPEVLQHLRAQVALRIRQLHLHPAGRVRDRIHPPVLSARRAVDEALAKVRAQRLGGRFLRLQQQPAVGQGPHLEAGPVAVELDGRGQRKALGRRHVAQHADGHGRQELVRPVVQPLVLQARLGAPRFELLERKNKNPGQQQRQQHRDRQLPAQVLHSPASMR